MVLTVFCAILIIIGMNRYYSLLIEYIGEVTSTQYKHLVKMNLDLYNELTEIEKHIVFLHAELAELNKTLEHRIKRKKGK